MARSTLATSAEPVVAASAPAAAGLVNGLKFCGQTVPAGGSAPSTTYRVTTSSAHTESPTEVCPHARTVRSREFGSRPATVLAPS